MAALGVVLARFCAPHFAMPAGFIIKLVGQLIAMSGLAVIAGGVSRRAIAQPPTNS
jgi:hypothetical protein